MAFAPSISRWPRVHVLAAMLLAVPCLAAVDAPIIVDPEWTLVSADAGGLRLTWKNAQSGRYGSARSRSLAIAVPPGCVADAVLENPQAASASVAVSAPARFRDVFIAAVSFTPGIPASGNPSAGAAFAASAIAASATAASPTEPARIRITFRTAAQPGSYRSAFAPPESAPSENGLRGWLANYSQSRDLRSTPVQAALAKAGAEGPSPGATLPKRRLVIKTAGEAIQWLDYAALARAGLPLGDIDPRRMRLYCEGREIPMFIGGEADGRWNPGDYIEFIGKRPFGQNSYNSLYTSKVAFILVWEGGALGLRAPAVPVASRTGGAIPDFPADAQAALPFHADAHFEEDDELLRIGSVSAEEIVDLGARAQETELTDFWYWKRVGAEKDLAEIPFTLPYTPALKAKGSGSGSQTGFGDLTVTINLKGITDNPNANPDHHLKFILNGTDISLVGGVEHDARWEGQDSYTWISPPLNPDALKPGKNVLVLQKVNDLKTSDNLPLETQDAYLNYFDLRFPATYAVLQDRIAFSNAFNDSAGLKLFTLSGFSTDKVSLWDKQGRKLTNFRTLRRGDGFEVSFLDTLAGKTEYLACGEDQRGIPALQLDTLDDLTSTGQGADYIVITDKSILGNALDSLVRFRAKQGLRTRVVRTDHIYQAFGTGTLDPAAIRRFVAYAYRNWKRPAPTYLALVGDASQSFEKNGEQPQVPFHPINIRGWGVAASDDYYGKVAGDDDLSDLFVGRIPANNQKELSNVVHKTLLAETARPPGHWNNQTLLISGFEPSFTAQNYVLQSIATANDRQYARIDLYPGSPQYKSPAQLTDFYARLDSGFNLVTFVGHGGGAVWSDAGVLTLKAIDQGKLQGEYPINLVASITCLTGFFEDQNARSLGEELIRLDKGGAAAFYGAAGYISNLAGEALSAEVVQAATSNAYATTGEIIARAETMVRLRTGDAFLPILAEFNLLGDPALGIRFPAAEGKLELDPQVLAGGADLEAKGTGLAVQDGEAVASVLLDDSLESNAGLKVAGGAFSLQRTFPEKPMAVQNGKVLVHYWNDKESRVLSAPFSSLDWLIDSVTIDPAGAAPGDSVRVSLRLNTAYAKTAFTAGIVSYAVGGSQAPLFPGDNQLGLESDDGVHLKSVSKILLGIPATDLSGPRLHLAFRLSVQALDPNGDPLQNIPGLSSRVYSLPLRELPRLELPKQALHLPIQETPGVWVLFHNKGMGTAQGTRVAMTRNADGDSPGTDTLAYPENIPAGAVDSLFFPLEESELGGKRLRAALVPDRQGDLSVTSTSQDTIFGVDSRRLSSSGDTLRLDGDGAFASLPDSAANPVRLYWEKIAVSSLPAHLDPAGGNLPLTAYSIQAWPFPVGGFLLGWTDDTASALPKIARTLATVGKSPAWHYRDREGQTWIKLDSLPGSAGAIRAAAFRPGVYALLRNRDVTGPQIQLSSRGQTLLPDDYVPRQTPIDVVIRDGEGVDLTLHPPRLVSREQSLDSANHAEDPANGFPTLARINFLPTHASDRDSITVTARDVSGNQTTKTMVYRLGDDLRIRDLGSYPNPFADTATFVYSLTDYCDKVDLKIYSRSGRVVRALQQRNVVGYQEMEWDGRAESGSNVANGLYFLKVTAKAGSKETSKIFKLFKKQRK